MRDRLRQVPSLSENRLLRVPFGQVIRATVRFSSHARRMRLKQIDGISATFAPILRTKKVPLGVVDVSETASCRSPAHISSQSLYGRCPHARSITTFTREKVAVHLLDKTGSCTLCAMDGACCNTHLPHHPNGSPDLFRCTAPRPAWINRLGPKDATSSSILLVNSICDLTHVRRWRWT